MKPGTRSYVIILLVMAGGLFLYNNKDKEEGESTYVPVWLLAGAAGAVYWGSW